MSKKRTSPIGEVFYVAAETVERERGELCPDIDCFVGARRCYAVQVIEEWAFEGQWRERHPKGAIGGQHSAVSRTVGQAHPTSRRRPQRRNEE